MTRLRSSRRSAPPPAVTVDEEGEAAGMAVMIAELLRANIADSPRRARAAARVRGDIVLVAADRGLGVTISFGDGGVAVSGRIAGGVSGGVPTLAGPWLEMALVCSGQRSPLRALARRRLRATRMRPLRVLLAAAFVLKVPRSAFAEERWRGEAGSGPHP